MSKIFLNKFYFSVWLFIFIFLNITASLSLASEVESIADLSQSERESDAVQVVSYAATASEANTLSALDDSIPINIGHSFVGGGDSHLLDVSIIKVIPNDINKPALTSQTVDLPSQSIEGSYEIRVMVNYCDYMSQPVGMKLTIAGLNSDYSTSMNSSSYTQIDYDRITNTEEHYKIVYTFSWDTSTLPFDVYKLTPTHTYKNDKDNGYHFDGTKTKTGPSVYVSVGPNGSVDLSIPFSETLVDTNMLLNSSHPLSVSYTADRNGDIFLEFNENVVSTTGISHISAAAPSGSQTLNIKAVGCGIGQIYAELRIDGQAIAYSLLSFSILTPQSFDPFSGGGGNGGLSGDGGITGELPQGNDDEENGEGDDETPPSESDYDVNLVIGGLSEATEVEPGYFMANGASVIPDSLYYSSTDSGKLVLSLSSGLKFIGNKSKYEWNVSEGTGTVTPLSILATSDGESGATLTLYVDNKSKSSDFVKITVGDLVLSPEVDIIVGDLGEGEEETPGYTMELGDDFIPVNKYTSPGIGSLVLSLSTGLLFSDSTTEKSWDVTTGSGTKQSGTVSASAVGTYTATLSLYDNDSNLLSTDFVTINVVPVATGEIDLIIDGLDEADEDDPGYSMQLGGNVIPYIKYSASASGEIVLTLSDGLEFLDGTVSMTYPAAAGTDIEISTDLIIATDVGESLITATLYINNKSKGTDTITVIIDDDGYGAEGNPEDDEELDEEENEKEEEEEDSADNKITFKIVKNNPFAVGATSADLEDISGEIGGTVYLIAEVKIGAGYRVSSNQEEIIYAIINDEWDGYDENSRAKLFTLFGINQSGWYKYDGVNEEDDTIIWDKGKSLKGFSNAGSEEPITLYGLIRKWNTEVEPYTQYRYNADSYWMNARPYAGHNGEHSIKMKGANSADIDGIYFEEYDSEAPTPGWQTPFAVKPKTKSADINNLVITASSVTSGNNTDEDFFSYDPVPNSAYNRPTISFSFTDTNLDEVDRKYYVRWLIWKTVSLNEVGGVIMNSNPGDSFELNVDYTPYIVLNEPGSYTLTWDGDDDTAEWSTYTFDLQVMEYKGISRVSSFMYKWPYCGLTGEHCIHSADDNECVECTVFDDDEERSDDPDAEGSKLLYAYQVHDYAYEQNFPNYEGISGYNVIIVDNDLDVVTSQSRPADPTLIPAGYHPGSGAEYHHYAGHENSTEGLFYYNDWRTVYTGQDNCWASYKRNHEPSRILSVNVKINGIPDFIYYTKKLYELVNEYYTGDPIILSNYLHNFITTVPITQLPVAIQNEQLAFEKNTDRNINIETLIIARKFGERYDGLEWSAVAGDQHSNHAITYIDHKNSKVRSYFKSAGNYEFNTGVTDDCSKLDVKHFIATLNGLLFDGTFVLVGFGTSYNESEVNSAVGWGGDLQTGIADLQKAVPNNKNHDFPYILQVAKESVIGKKNTNISPEDLVADVDAVNIYLKYVPDKTKTIWGLMQYYYVQSYNVDGTINTNNVAGYKSRYTDFKASFSNASTKLTAAADQSVLGQIKHMMFPLNRSILFGGDHYRLFDSKIRTITDEERRALSEAFEAYINNMITAGY